MIQDPLPELDDLLKMIGKQANILPRLKRVMAHEAWGWDWSACMIAWGAMATESWHPHSLKNIEEPRI